MTRSSRPTDLDPTPRLVRSALGALGLSLLAANALGRPIGGLEAPPEPAEAPPPTAFESWLPFAGLEAHPALRLPDEDPDGPWRLGPALGAPPWLTISGSQRTRFESLDEDFRANRNGHNQLFAFRTLLKGTVRQEEFELTAEFQDSRQYGAPSKGQLGTSIVNAAELLQAYVALEFESAFEDGDRLYVQAGRHTMDIGSRRLVARNRFRNTINAFTGINALWEAASGAALRAFFVLPVQRRPTGSSNYLANNVAFDEERKQVRFFGLDYSTPKTEGGLGGEVYAFGLLEKDGHDLATRDRELWTLGARAKRAPKQGFLFELESAIQFGQSRSSASATNTTDLDHLAHFHHASAGYGFDCATRPGVEVLVDYASGDDDPTDGDNNRFDTLFGARRFEYGPTGIFGAFARSNIFSPGYRLKLKPCADTEWMITHRFHYLASDQDAWTTSGVVDPAGNSGSYIGHLLESRLRWDIFPKNLRFEIGFAHLFAGRFAKDAPNASSRGDATYFYCGTNFSF